jgi:hypothetical protein
VQAAKKPGQDLPEEFFEVQDFAIVPVDAAEWDHLINPVTMRLLGAMGCLGPRPLEGHAFWRIAADALKEDARTAAVIEELMCVAAPLFCLSRARLRVRVLYTYKRMHIHAHT